MCVYVEVRPNGWAGCLKPSEIFVGLKSGNGSEICFEVNKSGDAVESRCLHTLDKKTFYFDWQQIRQILSCFRAAPNSLPSQKCTYSKITAFVWENPDDVMALEGQLAYMRSLEAHLWMHFKARLKQSGIMGKSEIISRDIGKRFVNSGSWRFIRSNMHTPRPAVVPLRWKTVLCSTDGTCSGVKRAHQPQNKSTRPVEDAAESLYPR